MISIIEGMLKNSQDDPCLMIDLVRLGRGMGESHNETDSYVTRTKFVFCWKVIGEELVTQEKNSFGVLFDAENYLIQWTFEIVSNNREVKEDTNFYHWRGCQSSKSPSPLPPTYNNETTIVERICQWSEPPAFFHIFPKPVVVLNGQEATFNPSMPHLFMLRGELTKEIHLFEVPFSKKNLRSRAIFFIVVPNEKVIYCWQGAAVPESYSSLVHLNLDNALKDMNSDWKHFETKHIDERSNDAIFLQDESDYFHIQRKLSFTPRLFYINSITGQFMATEVQYSLRSTGHTAAFPFLQSHLYTADEPARFLLDNHTDIWLWKGQRIEIESDHDSVDFDKQLEVAEKIANEYAKEKERIIGEAVSVSYVEAGSETVQFTNIFPYWNT